MIADSDDRLTRAFATSWHRCYRRPVPQGRSTGRIERHDQSVR
jgi:hypothetical protein